MTDLVLILPYWVYFLIFFIVVCILGAIFLSEADDEGLGCGGTIFFCFFAVCIWYFSEFYERVDQESANLEVNNYKTLQYKLWTRDSISFLSERLSARKSMEKKVREDTLNYYPIIIDTIELLENKIRDYEFRILALKDALIDSNIRKGITSKADAESQRKDYGSLMHFGTGIKGINPDDMSITGILWGSPASDAGLLEGDIITEIIPHNVNEWKTMESSDIADLTAYYTYWGNVALLIKPVSGVRNIGRIGIMMQVSGYGGSYEVTIDEIFKGLPAEKAGLKVGDRIVKINDSIMVRGSDFKNHFISLNTVEFTKLGIIRDGKEKDIIVENILESNDGYELIIEARGIPLMIDETYMDWVKTSEGLKLSLNDMKSKQKYLYVVRRKNELDPSNEDNSKEIDNLILEAIKSANRNIELFKLGVNDE